MKKSYMRRWAICICTSEPLALVSLGDCTPALAPFDFSSDNSKWNFRKQ